MKQSAWLKFVKENFDDEDTGDFRETMKTIGKKYRREYRREDSDIDSIDDEDDTYDTDYGYGITD